MTATRRTRMALAVLVLAACVALVAVTVVAYVNAAARRAETHPVITPSMPPAEPHQGIRVWPYDYPDPHDYPAPFR